MTRYSQNGPPVSAGYTGRSGTGKYVGIPLARTVGPYPAGVPRACEEPQALARGRVGAEILVGSLSTGLHAGA